MRYTPKLHLPIFEKGETPALIGDLNAAMLTIDDNAGGGESVTIHSLDLITRYSPYSLGLIMQEEQYDFIFLAGAIAYGEGAGTRQTYYFGAVFIPFYQGGAFMEEDDLCLQLNSADNAFINYVTDSRNTRFTAYNSSNIRVAKDATVYGVKL